MLLKRVSIALLGFAFYAAGQESPQVPHPDESKTPSLDVHRWIRGEFEQTQTKRPFIVTPEVEVTPGRRSKNFEKTESRKCSIPLLEFKPEANSRMRVIPPNGKGHMRFLKPPAPPCEPAVNELRSLTPKPAPDSQAPKK
jgi:hypothetical protein